MSAGRAAHPAAGGRFLPGGAVTGVGSLPHATAAEAVGFVAAHSPAVPFAPQPPLDGSVWDAVGEQLRFLSHRDGRHRWWFDAFHAAVMAGAFPRARALKVQVTGPVTLAQMCTHEGSPADHRPEALAVLRREVTALAVWQLRRLRPAGLPVLVVVDEPALGGLEPGDREHAVRFLARPMAAVRASGGLAGLHCCVVGVGPAALGAVDVASFDATARGALDVADLAALADPARLAAFGLVPGPDGGALAAWLQAAAGTGDPVGLARRTLVTPTCGLGRRTEAAAEAAFTAASAPARAIGRLAWEAGASALAEGLA